MSILLFTSCNSQIKENKIIKNNIIEKIKFMEVNTSEPISNQSFEKKIIQFSLDSISLFKEKYIRDSLVNSDKMKSYLNSNKKLFLEISEKYLSPKHFPYLNYFPENDEEYINVFIFLKNSKVVNWRLRYEENDLPQELKLLYKKYIISKNKLL